MAARQVIFEINEPEQSVLPLHKPQILNPTMQKIYDFIKTITPELQLKIEQFMKKHIESKIYPRISTERCNIYEDIYIIFCLKAFEEDIREPRGMNSVLQMIERDTGRKVSTIKERVVKRISQVPLKRIQICMDSQIDLPYQEYRTRQRRMADMIRQIQEDDKERSPVRMPVNSSQKKQKQHSKEKNPKDILQKDEAFEETIAQLKNQLSDRERMVHFKTNCGYWARGRKKSIDKDWKTNKLIINYADQEEEEQEKVVQKSHKKVSNDEKRSLFSFACKESAVVPYVCQEEPSGSSINISTFTHNISPPKKKSCQIMFVYRRSTNELLPVKKIDTSKMDLTLQRLRQQSLQAQQGMKNLLETLFRQEQTSLTVVEEDEEKDETLLEATLQEIEEEKQIYKRYMRFLDEIQENIKMVKPTENNLALLLYLQNATTKMKISSKLNYEQFRLEMGLASKTSKTKTGSKRTMNYGYEENYDEIFSKSLISSQKQQSSQQSSQSDSQWCQIEDELLENYINNPINYQLEFTCLRRYKTVEQIRSRMQRLKILPPNLKEYSLDLSLSYRKD